MVASTKRWATSSDASISTRVAVRVLRIDTDTATTAARRLINAYRHEKLGADRPVVPEFLQHASSVSNRMGADANPAYLVGASWLRLLLIALRPILLPKNPQFCSTPPERVPLHLHCMTEGAKLQGQGWQNDCQMFPASIGTHGLKGGVG